MRNSFGQRPITHAGLKVYGIRPSIQGMFLFIYFFFRVMEGKYVEHIPGARTAKTQENTLHRGNFKRSQKRQKRKKEIYKR